jgi:hypothetical protein
LIEKYFKLFDWIKKPIKIFIFLCIIYILCLQREYRPCKEYQMPCNGI